MKKISREIGDIMMLFTSIYCNAVLRNCSAKWTYRHEIILHRLNYS